MRSILSLLRNNYRECLVLVLFLLMTGVVQAERIEGIVAVVDDRIIMVSDLRQRMEELGAPLENRVAQRQVLELMVEDIVVGKIYKSLGFPLVNQQEAEQLAQRNKISVHDATSMIMKSTLMDIMVKSRVVVTENMIKDYYNASDEYSGRQSVRLRQILIKEDSEKAQKAYDEIKGGGSFEEVAQEYSDILRAGGADIGWVAIEDLTEQVRKAVEAAGQGDVIGPMEMNSYIAIFEIVEKGVAGTRNLEDTRPEIFDKLVTKYQQEAFQHWLKKMMSEYFIGIYI